MLLNFGAKNFYSFREGVDVSFELGAGCPESISRRKTASNLLCVKGANGSGKTNILKIISFLKELCANSFDKKPGDKFHIDSYFFSKNEIEIYCEFEISNITYRYEASLTNDKILTEEIFRKKRRLTSILFRKGNKLEGCTNEFSELKKIKLRDNSSIISTAHQYTLEKIKPIYNFFQSMLTNVTSSGRKEFKDYRITSELYHSDEEAFTFAKAIIKKCDLGITNIQILHIKNEDGSIVYFPVFEHSAPVKDNKLVYHSESSGTRALYNILPAYKIALSLGSVLILDEFDINFHPDILPILVGMFDDKKTNKKNAQMIFTTHNDMIMDLMGKYRTFLVNQEAGESFGYRLDEIPGDIIRNDRSISSIYKTGKIGGVPRI